MNKKILLLAFILLAGTINAFDDKFTGTKEQRLRYGLPLLIPICAIYLMSVSYYTMERGKNHRVPFLVNTLLILIVFSFAVSHI